MFQIKMYLIIETVGEIILGHKLQNLICFFSLRTRGMRPIIRA